MRNTHATPGTTVRVWIILLVALLAIAPAGVQATILRALDLPEIVQQAEIIADVTVIHLESYWASPAGVKAIRTKVTFALNRPALKGQVSSPFSLEFLGGTVGNRRIVVDSMPQLLIGERVIIFSYGPDKAFVSPFIGMDQGIMRVVHDDQNSVDRVYRWWGQPVNEWQSFKDRITGQGGTAKQSANSLEEFLGRVGRMQNR
jgi:hypothetical protein